MDVRADGSAGDGNHGEQIFILVFTVRNVKQVTKLFENNRLRYIGGWRYKYDAVTLSATSEPLLR
jgi:hypothetical protein